MKDKEIEEYVWFLEKITPKIHDTAVAKGWWEDNDTKSKRALVITEISEAIEASRTCKSADWDSFNKRVEEIGNSFNGSKECFLYEPLYREKREREVFISQFENYIKDSIGDELADTVIRICDLMAHKNVSVSSNEMDALSVKYSDSKYDLFDVLFDVSKYIPEAEGWNFTRCLVSIIRYCHENEIKLRLHITHKMQYNTYRSYRHGGKKF